MEASLKRKTKMKLVWINEMGRFLEMKTSTNEIFKVLLAVHLINQI